MMWRAGRSLTLLIGLSTLVLACGERQGQAGPIRDLIRERVQARAGGPAEAPGAAAGGTQEVAVTVGGQRRSFLVSTPPGFDRSRRYPAMLVFHGGGGNVDVAQRISGMSQAAAAGGFLAVYPISPDSPWNDGRATTRASRDDVAYVDAVLDELEANWAVDSGRVFASGVSSGGMFVERLACDMPRAFAGFAVVAANMPAELADRCDPSVARPMMFFMGTADPMMPFQGGEIASSRLLGVGSGGQVLSTERTLDFWTRIHGCDSASVSEEPDRANDETRVTRVAYSGCDGGPIVFYRIEGGGHTWPGAEGGRGAFITGPTSQDVDATADMVDFFRDFGL